MSVTAQVLGYLGDKAPGVLGTYMRIAYRTSDEETLDDLANLLPASDTGIVNITIANSHNDPEAVPYGVTVMTGRTCREGITPQSVAWRNALGYVYSNVQYTDQPNSLTTTDRDVVFYAGYGDGTDVVGGVRLITNGSIGGSEPIYTSTVIDFQRVVLELLGEGYYQNAMRLVSDINGDMFMHKHRGGDPLDNEISSIAENRANTVKKLILEGRNGKIIGVNGIYSKPRLKQALINILSGRGVLGDDMSSGIPCIEFSRFINVPDHTENKSLNGREVDPDSVESGRMRAVVMHTIQAYVKGAGLGNHYITGFTNPSAAYPVLTQLKLLMPGHVFVVTPVDRSQITPSAISEMEGYFNKRPTLLIIGIPDEEYKKLWA